MNRAPDEPSDDTRAPRRQLSLFDSTSIIIGIIIGAGLYETAPLIASCVTGPGALVLVWSLGAAFAMVGALCYAEMATAYPAEGGDYLYLTRAYGRRLGLLFGWTQLSVVRPGSIGAMAYVFARYASRLAPLGTYGELVYAAIAVTALSAINIVGVRQAKWVQNILTMAKVAGLAGVLALGFFSDGSARVAPDTTPAGPGNFGLAVILVLWAYSGWNEMAYVAAELRDPQRNIVRALAAGTLSVVALYLAANAAFLYALGFSGLAHSTAAAADVVRPVLGERGAAAMSALVCISALGAMNGMTFTGSRLYYAMGRDHPLFAPLGRWSPRFGTPVCSLVVEGAITLATVLLLGWMYAREGNAFQQLVNFTAPMFWFFLGLAAAAVIVLRVRNPAEPRLFRVPLYPLTPLVFLAGCLYMLYASLDYALAMKSWEALWPIGAIVVGLLLAAMTREKR